MWDQFFKTDMLHVMNSTIPLFKSQPGYTMKINIAIASKNVLHFFIEVMNHRNERVSLSQLDKITVDFFVNEYHRFICGTSYERSYSVVGVLRTLKNLILNREFSIYAFLSSANLPNFLAYNIFTFDTASNECLAKIIVRKGNMGYIFNSNCLDIRLWYLSTLNFDLVLHFLMHENEYSVKIIERLLSYSRKIILSVIVIFNVVL